MCVFCQGGSLAAPTPIRVSGAWKSTYRPDNAALQAFQKKFLTSPTTGTGILQLLAADKSARQFRVQMA